MAGNAKPLQTLTGLTVPIVLARNRYNHAAYRLKDIDYAQSCVYLVNSSGSAVEGSQYYFSEALLREGTNYTWTLNYPITVSLAGRSGTFTPVLHLVYLDGSVWNAEGAALYMNDAPVEDGFYPVELSQEYSTVTKTTTLGGDTTQLSLGTAGTSEINFTFQSVRAETGPNQTGYMDMQIWNQKSAGPWELDDCAVKAPQLTVGAATDAGTAVTSTLPIRVISPVPVGGSVLGKQFTLPIYTDTATIQFEDVFGQTYTQDITASPFGDLSVTLSETADLPDQSGQAIRLAFSIRDDSPVNLIVKNNAAAPNYDTASDPIDGLTVTGSSFTWEGTTEKTVHVCLVDSQNNAATALELTFPAVDKTPPTATVEYQVETESVRAYLVPSDADKNDFIPLDAANLTLDESDTSAYRGCYYYEFTSNGTYTFRFSDEAGNVATVPATVHSIDNTVPEVLSTQWLNQGRTYTDEEWRDAQNSIRTNAPVTVTLTLNTQLKEVTAPTTDGVTISFMANQAQVTFSADTAESLNLTLTARNGRTTTVALPRITCIDTTAPTVSVTGMTAGDSGVTWNAAGSYTVTYTAADNAQNAATVTRTLVLTRENPMGLKVNGQTVYQGSTLSLGKGTASLTLTGADTPVYLALKQGYKTVAQMKLNAQVLLNGSYTGPVEASLTGTGFYTLYLRTQDRTEYVYYLYIQG